MTEMGRTYSTYGTIQKCILVQIIREKPEGKRPFGRLRRRWEDNKMDLREMNCEAVEWIDLAQDRVQCLT